MSRNILFRRLLTISLLVVVTFIWCAASTSHASADCGNPPKSSCISCHALDGHVEVMGEWNSVHLTQVLCTNCHGGNGSATDKTLAHEGVVAQPLSDVYTNCHSCHPTDYLARSAQFAVSLNITPSSCATPTAFAIYDGSDGSHLGNVAIAPDNKEVIPSWQSIVSIIGTLASLAFFMLGLCWLNCHHVKG